MKGKIQFSTIAIAIIVFASLWIDFDLKSWNKSNRVIEHDVHWYYAYLPAQFIYHDITLSNINYKYGDLHDLFWTVQTPEGKNVIKSTLGLSILYAPFFFVAHTFAHFTNYAENGFSEPYKIFLLLSAVFYLFVGLDYVRKILRHYNFSEAHIAITLLLIGLGTNLLCYASQSAPMPHVYNFFLFAVFIFYTIRWYESQSAKNTIILGLTLGLISLIRPSNGIILIFFFLYGVSTVAELKERMTFLKRDWFLINVIGFFAFLIWVPQFMYWKATTGNYLCDSYPGESFFFGQPKILSGFFGFRKGWLLYTPMMAFSLVGLFLMKGVVKKLRLPIILFFVVNVYIIFSWWCWWYGGTYGQRSMIDSFPILAIPFASFVQYLSGRKWIYKGLFICIAVFFIWLNIFQTYQFEFSSLHWDGMTKELYVKQFGKLDPIKDFYKWVKVPSSEAAKRGERSENQLSDLSNSGGENNYNKKKVLSKKRVCFKAFNNKFLCADEANSDFVVANRDDTGNWETFSLVTFENNECVIQSFKNLFLSVELNEDSEITATRPDMGGWESFTRIDFANDYVAFKAVDGKYFTVDEKKMGGQVFATSDEIGDKEKFKILFK